MIIIFATMCVIPSHAQLQKETNETMSISGNDTSITFDKFSQKFLGYFGENGQGWNFIMFILGLSGFSIFVYFSYRYISKRELIPRFHLLEDKSDSKSTMHTIAYISSHVVAFPIIIFAFFVVYAILIFLTSQELLPIKITLYVAMALIGIVRVTSYFREELAEQLASNIPFCLLAVFLTSTVVADPNFLTVGKLSNAFTGIWMFMPAVISAIIVLSILEGICRLAFIVKRKILPIKEKSMPQSSN